jgi:hypothetical protein
MSILSRTAATRNHLGANLHGGLKISLLPTAPQ